MNPYCFAQLHDKIRFHARFAINRASADAFDKSTVLNGASEPRNASRSHNVGNLLTGISKNVRAPGHLG